MTSTSSYCYRGLLICPSSKIDKPANNLFSGVDRHNTILLLIRGMKLVRSGVFCPMNRDKIMDKSTLLFCQSLGEVEMMFCLVRRLTPIGVGTARRAFAFAELATGGEPRSKSFLFIVVLDLELLLDLVLEMLEQRRAFACFPVSTRIGAAFRQSTSRSNFVPPNSSMGVPCRILWTVFATLPTPRWNAGLESS